MKIHKKNISFFILLGISLIIHAQTTKDTALLKIKQLNTLISKVEAKKMDATKEKMTVRTAIEFLKFADWDEANFETNKLYFSQSRDYKNNADEMAKILPGFERKDVVKMLDEAIVTLTQIQQKKIIRKPSLAVNWDKVTHDGDQLTLDKRPVFLATYTWLPKTKELSEYHGNMNNFYITPTYLLDDKGSFKPSVVKDANDNENKSLGFVFIASGAVPKWTTEKYGEDFTKSQGAPFTNYDIDNPGAREMMSYLFKAVAGTLSGKRYTDLGYMLCNEPRWISYKNGKKKVWYMTPVSNYTIVKYKTWLKNKHKSISELNSVWGTNFASFEDVIVDNPIDLSKQGTPPWYDWSAFNDYRVTDWFTWMKAELLKYDPIAKVHFKIMPSFFSDNVPANGIDLEALTEMSEISGNDVAALNFSKHAEPNFKGYYAYDWRELYMSYDFLKSVNPDKIIFNTESHLITTNKSKDLYMDPAYIRASFWGAHTLGLNASQIWYWPRKADGSLDVKEAGQYPASNNQQPRVTNEIHSTMFDLNAYSEEITAMQRQRKPIRIYYSKTSSYNNHEYMDGIFELYEDLNFEGVPLGFVTPNIISKQDNKNWDLILVYKTENVTQTELDALQSFLNNGGTVIIDAVSCKKNEYGAVLPSLTAGKGKLIYANSYAEMSAKAMAIVDTNKHLPDIAITETNTGGHKGCTWKCVKNAKGNNVLSIINMGKTTAKLNITLRNSTSDVKCFDLLKGIKVTNQPSLKPYEVYFVEVKN